MSDQPRQGDVFWIDEGTPTGSEPGYRRPAVVIQNDALNTSPIRTVIVAGVTSNTRLARAAGNVLLSAGEAGLPRDSVVVVTQLVTVDRGELVNYSGRLSAARLRQVIQGVRTVIEPRV